MASIKGEEGGGGNRSWQHSTVAQDDETEMDRITSLQYNNMCGVGSWTTLLNFIKVGGDVERGP